MNHPALNKTIGSVAGLLLALASSCTTIQEPPKGTGSGGEAGSGVSSGGDDGVGGGGGIGWGEGGNAGKCEVDELLEGPAQGAKVKNLLTGLPLDDTEYVALRDQPDKLPQYIDTWLELPEADRNLRRFFMSALQQDGVSRENFFSMLGQNDVNTGRFQGKQADGGQLPNTYPKPNGPNMDFMFRRAMSESMARTAVEMVKAGTSFNEVVETDTYMMTTAMMALMAFYDDNVISDDKSHDLRTTVGHFDTITLVAKSEDAPPVNEALDPNHENFGKFFHPNLATTLARPSCGYTTIPDEIVLDPTQPFQQGQWRVQSGNHSYFVFSLAFLGRTERIVRHATPSCVAGATTSAPPLMQYDDFFDWRPVTVRAPGANETPHIFYEFNQLRGNSELVVHTPRRGFLSHPGFFGTWMTNEDNGARVTANQALIVALGKSFESAVIPDYAPTNVDGEHASETQCYGCHQTLDPMRDLVRGTFTNYYGHQLNDARKDMPTDFVFDGVEAYGVSGIDAFAQNIADHPTFPHAWAQKLCYFANAEACPEGEELDRVVQAFTEANLDFRALIRELFSSPLVTGGACVDGLAPGTTATIARRSTFCAQLSHRTGVNDACALSTESQAQNGLQQSLVATVESIPDDGYSRDEIAPVTIAETGMFVRANREVACNFLAFESTAVLFGGLTLPLTDQGVTDGLKILVEKIMGLPASDPRHEPAMAILRDHVEEVAQFIPEDQTDPLPKLFGLMSAVPIACMAPSFAGVGF